MVEVRAPGREKNPVSVKLYAILNQPVSPRSHLAGLRTVRIKLDLLGSQLPPSVHIIAQVNLTKRTLAQKLSSAPRHWSTWC